MGIAAAGVPGAEASLARLALERGSRALRDGSFPTAVRALEEARVEAVRTGERSVLQDILALVRDGLAWWGVASTREARWSEWWTEPADRLAHLRYAVPRNIELIERERGLDPRRAPGAAGLEPVVLRRWRPKAAVIARSPLSVVACVVALALAVHGTVWAAVALFAGVVALAAWKTRLGLQVSPAGLTVRNRLRTYTAGWDDVAEIGYDLVRGRPGRPAEPVVAVALQRRGGERVVLAHVTRGIGGRDAERLVTRLRAYADALQLPFSLDAADLCDTVEGSRAPEPLAVNIPLSRR